MDTFTPTWPQRRFRAFARRHWGEYSIAELCARARIGRSTFYDWCHIPGFPAWLAQPVRITVRHCPPHKQQQRGDSAINETLCAQNPDMQMLAAPSPPRPPRLRSPPPRELAS